MILKMGEAKPDLQPLIAQCEAWIRAGDFARAQSALKRLRPGQISRRQLPEICRLARRAQLWRSSLKWLRPYVRPKVRGALRALPAEKLEYALALQRAGAFNESRALLDTIHEDGGRVALARAFIEMFHWEYASAKALFDHALARPELSDYERLTARINRLACLSFLQEPEFPREASDLEREIRLTGSPLLAANFHEISAQYWVSLRRFGEADAALSAARAFIREGVAANKNALFIEKWTAILNALRFDNPAALESFRPQALALEHWETLRDLDFYHGLLRPDGPLLARVYFGTPFPSFQRRIESFWSPPESAFVARIAKPVSRIDPWSVQHQMGELPHRFFVALLEDLYRPARVGEVFQKLFASHHFELEASTNRVHQLVNRTRSWLKSSHLPFELREDDGQYSLRPRAEVAILYRRGRTLRYDRAGFFFDQIGMDQGWLSARELGERFGMSGDAVRRLVREALNQGIAERRGAGRYIEYRARSK